MRTAIVYYSLNGNTAMVAGQLAASLSADLIRIVPERSYPEKGLRKFLWGGKSAVMAETPKLLPYEFNAGTFDQVVFGFPVWAGNVAPPIRTFVQENRESLQGKKIAAFACQSGSGGERAFRKLLDCLGRTELAASMILNDPKDRPDAGNDTAIEAFRSKLS